jgi:hypothetical protein
MGSKERIIYERKENVENNAHEKGEIIANSSPFL